jgi:hypothetical protein
MARPFLDRNHAGRLSVRCSGARSPPLPSIFRYEQNALSMTYQV